MSDRSVAEALRSDVQRVVIEAPAGTGKTHQAASYAQDTVHSLHKGQRVLILAHTHAACGVFATRTAELRGRLQIGTIDALVAQIARAYHKSLDLPADLNTWSVDRGGDSFSELARRVRSLLTGSTAVRTALVHRFPIVICDEHQDASDNQDAIIKAMAAAGARLRLFGDPMQVIYGSVQERRVQQDRWRQTLEDADAVEPLDTPHRWANGSPALGEWVLAARTELAAGGRIDLRGRLPVGITTHRADNRAPRRGAYQLSREERRPLDTLVRVLDHLLILCPHIATVRGLNAFWGRRIPIWEGHSRDALGELLQACQRHQGNALELGRAFTRFIHTIGIGFTAGAYSDRLLREIETGCAVASHGKPARIQALARSIHDAPNYLGVGTALAHLHHFMSTENSFGDITIDMRREFDEARQLHVHTDLGTALTRIAHHRTTGHNNKVPPRALSSVHKSKGLESQHALVMPCDAHHFADNHKNRCLLYVALSRASHSLALVVSPANPSPLFSL